MHVSTDTTVNVAGPNTHTQSPKYSSVTKGTGRSGPATQRRDGYAGEQSNQGSEERPYGGDQSSLAMPNQADNGSMVSKMSVSTIKAKRMIQIQKLENEYARLSRRFEQVTDPMYLTEIKSKLAILESAAKEKYTRAGKLEREQ